MVVTAVAACGSARRGEPVAGPMPPLSAAEAHGERVFMTYCHQCHPKGENGLGPAINNKPLPEFLMRFQVRQGLGAMPAFSDDAIDARDLDGLMAYLKVLRRHG